MGVRIGVGCLLAALLVLAGCGDDADDPAPTGPFAESLAEVGGGGAAGSLGVGWLDPQSSDPLRLARPPVSTSACARPRPSTPSSRRPNAYKPPTEIGDYAVVPEPLLDAIPLAVQAYSRAAC